MKKLILLTLIALTTATTWKLEANRQCLNDRLHCERYQAVCCDCPCDRYKQSYNRGRCERCLHFRAPENYQIGGEPDNWLE